jgi:hypothetical protein
VVDTQHVFHSSGVTIGGLIPTLGSLELRTAN